MAVVTPTDCPKLVRNRCVIEVFGGVFMMSIGWIFCWCKGFHHRTESHLVPHFALIFMTNLRVSGFHFVIFLNFFFEIKPPSTLIRTRLLCTGSQTNNQSSRRVGGPQAIVTSKDKVGKVEYPLTCLFLIGRDCVSLSVTQSEFTLNGTQARRYNDIWSLEPLPSPT